VADYRLYFLDSEGHIVKANEIRASGDREAIRAARRRALGKPADLWCGARQVALLEAKTAQAGAETKGSLAFPLLWSPARRRVLTRTSGDPRRS